MSLTAHLPALLEALNAPAAILSSDYRLLATNQAYQRLYGDGKSLSGRHCYEVSHGYQQPCDQAGEACPLKLCRETGRQQRLLHQHQTATGEEHVDIEMSPLYDGDGQLIGYLERLHQVREAHPQAQAQGLIGQSPAFNQMLSWVRRAAPSEISVLLLGETGTGKELVARALHQGSPRASQPFVTVECSGLPETLFESELFGHEKGAFTGALGRKEGLVAAAHGGTLFLDEIGEIPLSQQVKLLRLIETKTYRSLGGITPQYADFRLICATHRDLAAQVRAGAFRADLYYRIAAFPIELPSLAERREDLPLLIQAMLQRLPNGKQAQLSEAALAALADYAFPGNIRELRNLLERALLLADGGEIDLPHLPLDLQRGCTDEAQPLLPHQPVPLKELEAHYLARLVKQTSLDRAALAQALGISERTLYRKLKGLKL